MKAGIAAEWGEFRQDREEVLRGLFDWEHQVFTKALPPSGRLLLIGSGTGRELIALASRGYHVTGIDPSARALATASRLLEEQRLEAALVEGFFEDAEIRESFDAVVFTHRAYGLIQGRRFRIAALRKAAQLIESGGGPVILSYLVGTGMHPVRRTAAAASARLLRRDLSLEPGDELFARQAGGFGFEHHFQPVDVASEVAEAGLTIDFAIDGSCPALVLRDTSRNP